MKMTADEMAAHKAVIQKRRDLWARPVLLNALYDMPTLYPVKAFQLTKVELKRIVILALNRKPEDPLRIDMQAALERARARAEKKRAK